MSNLFLSSKLLSVSLGTLADFGFEHADLIGELGDHALSMTVFDSTGITFSGGPFQMRMNTIDLAPVDDIDTLYAAVEAGTATGTLTGVTLVHDGVVIIDIALTSSMLTLTSGEQAFVLEGAFNTGIADFFELIGAVSLASNPDIVTAASELALLSEASGWDVSGVTIIDRDESFGVDFGGDHILKVTLPDLVLTLDGTPGAGADLGTLLDMVARFAEGGEAFDPFLIPDSGVTSMTITDPVGKVLFATDGSYLTDPDLDVVLQARGNAGDLADGIAAFFGALPSAWLDARIFGGRNSDHIIGLDGDNTIIAKDGADTVFGGTGDDQILGGGVGDQLFGGAGDDLIFGNKGRDFISGGRDSDTIEGGGGNDTATGDSGDDDLSGGTGRDHLSGDGGNDTIAGNGGNDTLFGGAGGDRLDGGRGRDILTGDGGADTFVFANGAGKDRVTDFKPGVDDIEFIGLADGLSAKEVVETYASLRSGDVVFDFGDGDVLRLIGVDTLAGLADDLIV